MTVVVTLLICPLLKLGGSPDRLLPVPVPWVPGSPARGPPDGGIAPFGPPPALPGDGATAFAEGGTSEVVPVEPRDPEDPVDARSADLDADDLPSGRDAPIADASVGRIHAPTAKSVAKASSRADDVEALTRVGMAHL